MYKTIVTTFDDYISIEKLPNIADLTSTWTSSVVNVSDLESDLVTKLLDSQKKLKTDIDEFTEKLNKIYCNTDLKKSFLVSFKRERERDIGIQCVESTENMVLWIALKNHHVPLNHRKMCKFGRRKWHCLSVSKIGCLLF